MKEIIQNIGLIVVSFTAIYGINAWRREFRGKKEYELAEEVLALFYDCRDRLRAIRSPFAQNTEGSSRITNPKETPEQTELLNRAYIVFERYKKNQDTFTKLFTLRYRFMALFGNNAAQPIEDLQYALNSVFNTALILPIYWQKLGHGQMPDDKFKLYLEEMRKHESVFWGTFSEKDEFNTKVEKMVLEMEDTCSHIIRPSPFWQQFCK